MKRKVLPVWINPTSFCHLDGQMLKKRQPKHDVAGGKMIEKITEGNDKSKILCCWIKLHFRTFIPKKINPGRVVR